MGKRRLKSGSGRMKKGVAEKLDMAYNLLVAEFAMWIGK